ncbi:MAG: hypothetical protein ABIG96_05330 [Candidatus Micrarchaeota archaeon]
MNKNERQILAKKILDWSFKEAEDLTIIPNLIELLKKEGNDQEMEKVSIKGKIKAELRMLEDLVTQEKKISSLQKMVIDHCKQIRQLLTEI